MMFPQQQKTGQFSAEVAPRVVPRCGILRAVPEDPAPFRVLVVDDEPLMRWSIAESLRDQHYSVIEASDGGEALRALSTVEVDAIILDYRLPDSHDFSLLARIRLMASVTPVVMITAHSSSDFTDHARGLGAHAVIEKPFEMRRLTAVLASIRQGL